MAFIGPYKDIQKYTLHEHTKIPSMLHFLLAFAKSVVAPLALHRNREEYEYLSYEKGGKQMAD